MPDKQNVIGHRRLIFTRVVDRLTNQKMYASAPAAVTQPQMISARRNEWVVSTIKPVMIGAKEAQMKLAKFWILPTDAVMREATATWIKPQQDVPAK